MSKGELYFECGPGLFKKWALLPIVTSSRTHSSTRKRHMVGNGNDLAWRVLRSSSYGSKGKAILNLGNKRFDWLIRVIVRLHLDGVCNEVGQAEPAVGHCRDVCTLV
jgi:hypothetical protein